VHSVQDTVDRGMSKVQKSSNGDLRVEDTGDFQLQGNKKKKSRSRNNSAADKKFEKSGDLDNEEMGKGGRAHKGSNGDLRAEEEGGDFQMQGGKKKKNPRSRNNSAGDKKFEKTGSSKQRNNTYQGRPPPARGPGHAKSNRQAKQQARQAKLARDYEDEEWRTVYIGFVERGTSEQELATHFKDSGEIERLTLKDGFAFILFKTEASVSLACKLDGSQLNGLNLRVAPRKEKPPQVSGEQLLDLDMKKFRQEKQEKIFDTVDDFLETFECVGSFSQDKKEPNSIVVPGCPPLLDWRKMEAEEGEITLIRQAENAPELNTTDSIFKSVSICSPELDLSKVNIVTNRQCLMKLLAPVDPSIVYTTNKCFRMTARKSPKGPIFLELEKKWHPTMGTSKSFQDAITQPLPEMVKNIAFPGIFYRINQFSLGSLTVMVRTQVHAEDEEPMLEFEESGYSTPEEVDEEDDDFFNIEERSGDEEDKVDNEGAQTKAPKLSVNAAEFIPPVPQWNTFEGTDMKWIKNDGLFCQPESKYEVKTVDIAGNYWEYNAEKSYYQMLLGGVDYLLLGVLLNNEYVINKEEYDLTEVQAKVMANKNPTNATIVLSKIERILARLVSLSADLAPEHKLEIVFDGRTEHLTFYKVGANTQEEEGEGIK